MSEFLRPKPEDQNIVLIDQHLLRWAEKLIVACEVCSPHHAETSFDSVVDRITGRDPAVTDYIFETLASCPHCRRQIHEKTLVDVA
jgi:hypothetical protein